jgi:hypothetical protein
MGRVRMIWHGDERLHDLFCNIKYGHEYIKRSGGLALFYCSERKEWNCFEAEREKEEGKERRKEQMKKMVLNEYGTL